MITPQPSLRADPPWNGCADSYRILTYLLAMYSARLSGMSGTHSRALAM